jgi:osomolarity two-component system sensor histidine kinase NIK1
MHSREILPAPFYTSKDLYTSQPKERMITCIPTNAYDQPPPPPPTTPKTESYTILIADDNNVNQRILKKMLSKHRHVTVSAYNGEEAFCAVQKRKYDIVLMDISMPVMVRPSPYPDSSSPSHTPLINIPQTPTNLSPQDGIEATLQIRAHERRMRITRTPIIALTARTMDAGEHPVFQSEIDDYLCKPIRMAELYEKVRRFGWMGRQAEEGEVQEVLDAIGKGGVRGERPEVWAKL